MQVNPRYLQCTGKPLEVKLELACQEVELDECWLWYAVDHATNTVLAYVFGKRMDIVFHDLKELLAPFNNSRYYTDDWGAYGRHLEVGRHEVGKRNTQKIERKNLNFRTWIKRLNRRSICFSKLERMHDVVIGLLINKVEFGCDIHA